MNKSITNTKKKDNNKSTKRRAYESLLLLLLTISLFITATFAWFTDTAFSKGNKIFAGNLYVDVVATLEQMVDRYNIDNPTDPINLSADDVNLEDINTKIKTAYPNLEVHDRKYRNPDYIDGTQTPDVNQYLHDYYYIITDQDLAVMNIYNIEPGQVRRATINYLNTGDLAFSAAGALKIDVDSTGSFKSYTGLETLNKQFAEGEDIFKNNYVVETNEETGEQYIDPQHIYQMNNGVNKGKIVNPIPDVPVVVDEELLQKGADTSKSNKSYTITKNVYSSFEDASNAYVEYDYRFNKLLEMQAIESSEETPQVTKLKAINSDPFVGEDESFSGYKDNGGHLEDILEVYIPSIEKLTPQKQSIIPEGSAVIDIGTTITPAPAPTKSTGQSNIREIILDKDNGYFFGTVRQFNYLMAHGYEASADFDYSVYSFRNDDNNKFILTKKVGESFVDVNRDGCLPEEEYMYLYEDPTVSLKYDYDSYLALAGGYCLPRDVLKDDDGCYPYNTTTLSSEPTKVEVKVYGGGLEKDYSYFANELGATAIAIYMPEDASSLYQNASISLSYGVTATQVEYEMDDTGCMIYDKYRKNNVDVKVGDVLVFDSVPLDENGTTIKLPLRAIKVDGTKVTFMFLRDFTSAYISLMSSLKGEEIEDEELAIMFTMLNSYMDFIGEISESDNSDYIRITPYVDSNGTYFAEGLDANFSAIDVLRCFGELLLLGKTESANNIVELMDEEGGLDDVLSALPEELKEGLLPQLTNYAVLDSFNQKGYVLTKTDDDSLYSLDNIYYNGPYYSADHDEVNGTYTTKTTNEYVRLLTLKDIYEFYGTDSLTNKQVSKFLYGKEDAYDDAPSVWLGDAALTKEEISLLGENGDDVTNPYENINSLLVKPDGTIISQNVMNMSSLSTIPLAANETRYVFTVDFSRVSDSSYEVFSNEKEDVDLDYDSPIWGNVKPLKPISIEDIIDDDDDEGGEDEDLDANYTTLWTGNAPSGDMNAPFYFHEHTNITQDWTLVQPGTKLRIDYHVYDESGGAPVIKICFGDFALSEIPGIELDASKNYYEHTITQENLDDIEKSTSNKTITLFGTNTTFTAFRLSKTAVDDDEEEQEYVYNTLWQGNFNLDNWGTFLKNSTEVMYNSWDTVPVGSKIRVEFTINDDATDAEPAQIKLFFGDWQQSDDAPQVDLKNTDTFYEITLTQEIIDLIKACTYEKIIIGGRHLTITSFKLGTVES